MTTNQRFLSTPQIKKIEKGYIYIYLIYQKYFIVASESLPFEYL